jgi:hypothetical protein
MQIVLLLALAVALGETARTQTPIARDPLDELRRYAEPAALR